MSSRRRWRAPGLYRMKSERSSHCRSYSVPESASFSSPCSLVATRPTRPIGPFRPHTVGGSLSGSHPRSPSGSHVAAAARVPTACARDRCRRVHRLPPRRRARRPRLGRDRDRQRALRRLEPGPGLVRPGGSRPGGPRTWTISPTSAGAWTSSSTSRPRSTTPRTRVPQKIVDVNIAATQRLFDAAGRSGAGKVLFTSSLYAYGSLGPARDAGGRRPGADDPVRDVQGRGRALPPRRAAGPRAGVDRGPALLRLRAAPVRRGGLQVRHRLELRAPPPSGRGPRSTAMGSNASTTFTSPTPSPHCCRWRRTIRTGRCSTLRPGGR